LNNCRFTACIVDEAGQCIEPLNYVPLLLGIDKLILVGDDKQLQPVVKSKVSYIFENIFISTFDAAIYLTSAHW